MNGDNPRVAIVRRTFGGLFPGDYRDVGHDIAAACALAAIAIPEQMATARLAGAPAATGLLVFVAGSLGFYLLGSNRSLSVGADSTIAPIFAGSLVLMAVSGSPQYLALAAMLALMVGAIVAAGGLFRMGWIARLLSVPVITGFLAGIAVHIGVSQLPALLGIANAHETFLGTLANLARNGAHMNLLTLAIGAAVFTLTFACERIDIRLPGALIATVLATGAVWLFGLAGKGVAILDSVSPAGLELGLPNVALSSIARLLPVALIVSLVVMIQTAATCRSFQDDGEAVGINRDLIGVGFSSILSGLFGGFPANSSPPRTAIVSESGGKSRFAGFCAALIVAAFFGFGLHLLAYVPEAALAGLLLYVAQRILRVGAMIQIAAQSRAEFALLGVTAAAIIIMPVAIGVGVGIVLSLLHGVWTITQTRAIEFERVPGSTVWWPTSPNFAGEKSTGIVVVGFQAPLFFLNAETFRKTLDDAVHRAPQPVRAIILEASSIVEMDFSGAQVLTSLIRHWAKQGVEFYVARLESLRAQRAFERFGIVSLLGERRLFQSVADAVRRIESS